MRSAHITWYVVRRGTSGARAPLRLISPPLKKIDMVAWPLTYQFIYTAGILGSLAMLALDTEHGPTEHVRRS